MEKERFERKSYMIKALCIKTHTKTKKGVKHTFKKGVVYDIMFFGILRYDDLWTMRMYSYGDILWRDKKINVGDDMNITDPNDFDIYFLEGIKAIRKMKLEELNKKIKKDRKEIRAEKLKKIKKASIETCWTPA